MTDREEEEEAETEEEGEAAGEGETKVMAEEDRKKDLHLALVAFPLAMIDGTPMKSLMFLHHRKDSDQLEHLDLRLFKQSPTVLWSCSNFFFPPLFVRPSSRIQTPMLLSTWRPQEGRGRKYP